MIPFLYALTCLIWGSTWVAIKYGLEGVPPFLGAALRFVIASGVLWALVLGTRTSPRLSRDGKKAALSAGLLSFYCSYALVYWSETRVASGLVAVFYSLMPLCTALLTAFVTRTETLTPAKTAGIVVGTAGVVVLFWPEHGVKGADPAGLLAALVSALVAAVNLVNQSLWSKKEDSRVLNAWAMSLGAILLVATSLALEQWSTVRWTPTNVAALLYLAVFGSVVAFLAFYTMIKRLPATQVSLITLIFPVVALALGWLLLGERVSPRAGAGVALIFGGVGLALVGQRARAAVSKIANP